MPPLFFDMNVDIFFLRGKSPLSLTLPREGGGDAAVQIEPLDL